MTTLVLDEKTEQTTIGDLLEMAGDRVIEIRHADGALVATIVLSRDDADYEALIAEAEQDIDEIRRRMQEPLSDAITTDQLLERLNSID